MSTPGTFQKTTVKLKQKDGYLLEFDGGKTIFMPFNDTDKEFDPGDSIEVFIYQDNTGLDTATTFQPTITLNQIELLEVKEVTQHGAFMDWGISKDLFIPFSEQSNRMMEGRKNLVYLYIDRKSERLTGTTKIERYLTEKTLTVKEKEKVDLIIWNKSDLGRNVIINQKHEGLIYEDDIFQNLRYGEKHKGFIKQIRPDNKIDVTLRPFGYEKVGPNADKIYDILLQGDGYLDLHDKSNPDHIRARLEMSKKTYKKAIGLLYRKDLIRIEDDGIYLVESENS
ncbi:GntR family transcriptional regulator [Rhodohalobacter sp. SW132]|uniref:CvfB family protein n=1 Tax=Rhodohalobacter sp. SW132 TaxID=2293433 RepID=UPI000E2330FE|nr:S1-like domain-containing RNA-binding protein [Rhodohalobacter sp. SW132]REL24291.1 GntR family transcriptional regulator [Rhodohalobacter sp. SW132]